MQVLSLQIFLSLSQMQRPPESVFSQAPSTIATEHPVLSTQPFPLVIQVSL